MLLNLLIVILAYILFCGIQAVPHMVFKRRIHIKDHDARVMSGVAIFLTFVFVYLMCWHNW